MAADLALSPFLKKLEGHVALSRSECEAVLSLPHKINRVPRGIQISRQGTESHNSYVIVSGFVARSKLLATGSRQVISVHLMGDGIDLQNALLPLIDHSIEALTPAQVAVIPSAAISELMGSFPQVARAIWVETLLDMAIQQEWTANSRRDASSRIAHLFCELGVRFEAAGLGKRDLYDLPVTQEQIADTTGLTAVHVNRVMQVLRAESLIGRSSSPFSILDWDRLRTVADFRSGYLRPLATAA